MGFGLASLGNMMGLSTAASIGSSIYGAKKSAQSAKRLQSNQLAWEKQKALNAHQWELQDLKKAGLNPALTAMGGSGAQTGSIGAPMPDTSGYSNAGTNALNALKQMLDYTQDLKRTANETAKTQAEIANTEADTAFKEITSGIATKTGLKEAQARIQNLHTSSAKNLADADTLSNALGKGVKPVGETIGDLLGGIKKGVGFFGRALGKQVRNSIINSAKKYNSNYDYQKSYPQL